MYTILALGMVVLYAVSTIAYAAAFFFASFRARVFATVACSAGFILHSVFFLLRAFYSGVPPLANLYESLLLFAWAIVLIFLLYLRRRRVSGSGAFVMPLVTGLSLSALMFDSAVRPLMPALQSPWLYVHVLSCFLSYACFACAFCIGVMYLLQERQLKSKHWGRLFSRLPSLDSMDGINHQSVLAGFLLLTFGIATGALWAERAWGSWWSWDPKETWSLITWLVYAVSLHARYLKGWQGKKTAVLSVVGFACVLFTYLGVSFLLPGMHAYL